MKNSRTLLPKAFILTLALICTLLLFCKSNPLDNGEKPDIDPPDLPEFTLPACVESNDGLDRSAPNLGIESAIAIKFNEGGAAEISYNTIEESVNVEINGGHVVVRGKAAVADGIMNVVLSGSVSNGSFKAYAGSSKIGIRLFLNGVKITNPKGPAVSFPVSKNIDSVLVNMAGCENSLTDAAFDYDAPLPDESNKGTFFSEAAVVFTGSGGLEVRSKSRRTAAGDAERGRHAIVVDNHFKMTNGNVIIHESTNDGIHANREITITGGTLQISSEGDAIQNERSNSLITIGGGAELTLRTSGVKSHGIACDSSDVAIGTGAKINITVIGNGAKGIRSRNNVQISGGDIVIDTYGNVDVTQGESEDDDGTSSASGVRAHQNFIMSNGYLTVKSRGENSKGINATQSATVTGGVINIKSVGDGIKTDGNLNIFSGKITTESVEKKGIDCKGVCTGCDNAGVVSNNKTGSWNFR